MKTLLLMADDGLSSSVWLHMAMHHLNQGKGVLTISDPGSGPYPDAIGTGDALPTYASGLAGHPRFHSVRLADPAVLLAVLLDQRPDTVLMFDMDVFVKAEKDPRWLEVIAFCAQSGHDMVLPHYNGLQWRYGLADLMKAPDGGVANIASIAWDRLAGRDVVADNIEAVRTLVPSLADQIERPGIRIPASAAGHQPDHLGDFCWQSISRNGSVEWRIPKHYGPKLHDLSPFPELWTDQAPGGLSTPAPSSLASPFDLSAAGIVLALLLMVLLFGLMPGLLAGLGAFSLTRWLTRNRVVQRLLGRRAGPLSAMLVILLPMLAIGVAGLELGRFVASALNNVAALYDHVMGVLLKWGAMLPAPFDDLLPSDAAGLQEKLAGAVQVHGLRLAGVGKTWIGALIFVVVGVVVGALAAISVPTSTGKLALAMRARGALLLAGFTKVVMAQVWIAAVNTLFTATLLFVAFPLIDVHIPYAAWLVLLTFVAGLLPIVGNLLCNIVLTIAGLGVGPHIAIACLVFLVAVHKLEYFINAKVMGSQIKTAAWELLIVMFAFEAVFGVVGLVAAPLYYAYMKMELSRLGWV
ncbi:AI-2E family transporter [Achromobacter anxifer]|uniref:AI-2E family transporter n=1 Tax=Achromobacter anxifer TaxID=1287737 RepID=UPI001591E71B|nr:AI-2E family transporter [Achromobacter anxifer]